MDQKMIELSNLRVLNDYLTQTIDALARAQRGASPFTPGISPTQSNGVTPFGTSPFGTSPFGVNADSIHTNGVAQWPFQSAVPQISQLANLYGLSALVGLGASPYTPTYPMAIDPFLAQRGFGYTPHASMWPHVSPTVDVARQAQLNQALAARQMVLEAMCRVAGIAV